MDIGNYPFLSGIAGACPTNSEQNRVSYCGTPLRIYEKMIKHTLFYRFRPDVPEDRRRRLLELQKDFPRIFPWMRNFALGRNISERDDSYEYALTVEFDTREDLDRYLRSDEHERHVKDEFRPLIESRAIVSFVAGEL